MLSSKEVDKSSYKHIYYKNLPDKNIEFFWYNFKESVNNAFNNLNQETKKVLKKYNIQENLIELSNTLNQLQQNEQFNEIQIKIENYIRDISRILFLPYTNEYHFNIFLTNLKRWDTWVLELPDKQKHKYEWLKNQEGNVKVNEDYFLIFLKFKKYITILLFKWNLNSKNINIGEH